MPAAVPEGTAPKTVHVSESVLPPGGEPVENESAPGSVLIQAAGMGLAPVPVTCTTAVKLPFCFGAITACVNESEEPAAIVSDCDAGR